MTNLQLHDAVLLNTQTPPLEGIILHHGPVSFSSGIWVGIRLTGSSIGCGKNNGTVEGETYFSAPEKGGLFMKEAKAKEAMKKRTMSRLEELRLKREVPEWKPGAGAAATAASPVRTRLRSSAAGSAKSSEDKESVSDRMKEIRAKRAALAKERKGVSTPVKMTDEEEQSKPATAIKTVENENKESDREESNDDTEYAPKVNLATATPGYRAELTRLQSTITRLQSELSKKETENASLQSSLDFMSKGAEQSTHDAVRMYALGALALSEKKSPKSRTTPVVVKDSEAAVRTPGEESARSLNEDLLAEEDESGSDGEEADEEESDDNDQVINKAAAAVSQALMDRNNELMAQLSEMASTKTNLEQELSESEERIHSMTQKLQALVEKFECEQQSRSQEQQNFMVEKSTLMSQLDSLQREYSILQERVSDKSENVSAVSLAKLKAEVATLQRKNTELENEKMDMETTLEELVLDKEALKEEHEVISDQLEELKIDLESTMLELEDARAQLSSGVVAVDMDGASTTAVEGSDAVRSIGLQNTRLRTAIVRLREQSEQEKNELQKQLRVFQSDSTSKESLQIELTELKSVHSTTLEEVQELKDMVDQTTSLEEMIETLSDKVWNLEQENANLERTIRELEESADVAAEMEEVQNEELKAIMRDLEGRDAMIRNLEEAIRMRVFRRREEDFQRYVSEFRATISTLKQEKAALIALTEGDQGEKSQLVAASQKALAQAAQLAADASAARKRDSEAAFDRIMARSATYLCQRLESLLPSGVLSAELAAIKGEIDLSSVVDKAAVSLSTVEYVFDKTIEKGLTGLSEFNILEEGVVAVLSDSSNQQIATMIHQTEFAGTVLDLASDALRFMAAGQWPDLMSEELSADLGNVAVHSISQLDAALSEQLKLLKQEGVLSPLQSSLSELNQSASNAKLSLFGISDQSGKLVIPEDWNPPGMQAFKSLSMGRFSCLGATAVLASVIRPSSNAEDEPPAPTLANLASIIEKAKQICSNVCDACRKFSGLDLSDNLTLESLNEIAVKYQQNSLALFTFIKTVFNHQTISSEDVEMCSSLLDEIGTNNRQLLALLRKAGLDEGDVTNFHELSPEFGDSWGGLTRVVSQVRAVDGDSEDINFLLRARAIEQKLAEAVENEPLLEKANSKIATLEQSLSSRIKEIALQNSRISELESLIIKSSATLMSPIKGTKAPVSPSTDAHKLKEEVRVLQEALDVMHHQVDEYEKEIRTLKDKSKTPRVSRQTPGRITPKKSSLEVDLEATLSQFGSATKSGVISSHDVSLESISLETALFRPALAKATQSASYWKSRSMGSAISKLPPLNVQKSQRDRNSYHEEINLARNENRLVKASFSIVDLSNDFSSRNQMKQQRKKGYLAQSRLHDATTSLINHHTLEKGVADLSVVKSAFCDVDMRGKIIVPCKGGTGFVAPMHVSKTELQQLHSFLVK